MEIEKSYDAVIAGGGIGGLVCANYLARAGLQVILVEKENKPGGCCTSFIKNGYRFDAGANIFASFGPGQLVGKMLEELEIDLVLAKMQNMILSFPALQIFVSQDLDYFREELKRHFPLYKDKVNAFFRETIKLYARYLDFPENDPELSKIAALTWQEYLDSYFDNRIIKDILSFLWLIYGSRPESASALAMIDLIGSFMRDGTYRIVGGAQVLPDALMRALEKKGGQAILGKSVEKIIIRDNRAGGVELDNGIEINAPVVVSNISAKRTFEMINQPAAAEGMRTGVNPFELFLGVDYPEADDYEGAYFGENNINHPMAVFVPTKYDRSLAPPSRQIIRITTPHEEGQNDQAEKTIDRASKFLFGLKDKIELCETAFPQSFGGSAYGWEVSPGQFYQKRLGQKTPLAGLYLAGHWTRPAGGVHSVFRSGKMAAELILNEKNI